MDVAAGAYLREVEAQFVELVKQGFALSARDVGRVLKWHAEGVPLRIVLGTLEEAVRRRQVEGGTRVLTLGQLERSIGVAMKRRAERMVSARDDAGQALVVAGGGAQVGLDPVAAEGPWGKLRLALEGAGKASAEPARVELRRAWSMVQRAQAEGGDPWQVAVEIDEALLVRLEGLLAPAEKVKMEQLVLARTTEAGPRMSAGARAEREAFERGRLVRERFGVPELLAVMLS